MFRYCYLFWVSLHLLTVLFKNHYENTPIQINKQFHLQSLKFSDKKKTDVFHISAQNMDCGYSLEPPQRGGSNEYPQSMFLSKVKKNNAYRCKPLFYCIKVRLKGVKIIKACFHDERALIVYFDI